MRRILPISQRLWMLYGEQSRNSLRLFGTKLCEFLIVVG